ncbi:iron chelate uptake ABC transporter family permease subunit [Paenibacillus sp. LMG 31461]|uniref:Iron chelate uptake ABC transporter family permease subunit n=1 Tax=Paenibacillus plantarum TaxID=2654975 RepID=A0ABX1XBM1_9BACL|nr:iron ABC transporter permease [Paenibacillus plantarum]NOU65847.1 iron chelate uptake ABC transporter family permease subunit [Paenibacillus plantarum]
MNSHSSIQRKRKSILVGLCLILLSVAVILISLNTGSIRLSPFEVWQTFAGYGSPDSQLVLFEYRLPRILITILAGIGLGVSGAILQGITRNGLADPGILGLHSGAALGLIVFVSFFHSMKGTLALLIPLFTFAGGVITAILIIALAYDRHKGIVPIRLILVGIAIAAGFSAVTLFLSLRLDEATYSFTARWLIGNVWGRDWVHVVALLPWIAILIPLALSKWRILNTFSLVDEMTSGLGVAVNRERLLLLMTAVALSSASVAMTGGIGFLGLVAPHLARRLVGPQHQYVLPISGLIGLVILVTSDTIGRSIFQPNAIPAGIVVAAVGAPYFLFLLARTK